MTIERKTIYLIAGVTMIVGAFFSVASALGGLISIIYVLIASTDRQSPAVDPAADMIQVIFTSNLSSSIAAVATFAVLFLGGRWMLRGPKMLDRWIDSSSEGGDVE